MSHSAAAPHGIPRMEGKITDFRSALGIRIIQGGQGGKRGPPDSIYRKHGEESQSVCCTCGSAFRCILPATYTAAATESRNGRAQC